jgi:hypothetical protein
LAKLAQIHYAQTLLKLFTCDRFNIGALALPEIHKLLYLPKFDSGWVTEVIGTNMNLNYTYANNFENEKERGLASCSLVTRSRVFAELRGSDVQRISEPLFAANVAFLIFFDWLSL